jgi:hypothetical protein
MEIAPKQHILPSTIMPASEGDFAHLEMLKQLGILQVKKLGTHVVKCWAIKAQVPVSVVPDDKSEMAWLRKLMEDKQIPLTDVVCKYSVQDIGNGLKFIDAEIVHDPVPAEADNYDWLVDEDSDTVYVG